MKQLQLALSLFYRLNSQNHQIFYQYENIYIQTQAILSSMGLGPSYTKDPNIDLYISLEKRTYYAGQTLRGTVLVRCLADRPYSRLVIAIQGIEKVRWIDDEISRSNQRKTYQQKMMIAQLGHNIRRGDYSYPFSILLPQALPASFTKNVINFIRYEITTYLLSQNNENYQFCKRPLHIRQPPRAALYPIKREAVTSSDCCCFSNGQTYMTLETEAKFLEVGMNFQFRALVDNSRNQSQIVNVKLTLCEEVKMFQDNGLNSGSFGQILLYNFPEVIPPGQLKNFAATATIPIDFRGYTAIGNIIYRAYFLKLTAEVSSVYSSPFVIAHVILLSALETLLEQSEMIGPPADFNPVIAEQLNFVALRPYAYNPLVHIKVINQGGYVPVVIPGPEVYPNN